MEIRPRKAKGAPPSEAKSEISMTRRTGMLSAGGLAVFGVLAGRFYQLQIKQGENYTRLSDQNRFNYQMVLPSRGIVRDRFGEPLATNTLDYRVDLIAEQASDLDATLDALSKVIPLTQGDMTRIRREVSRKPDFVPVTIRDHLDWEDFAALNLNIHALPGVVPTAGEGRAYPEDGVFSHVLGYVGRANDQDIERDDDPMLLQPAFRLGKTGVEQAADKDLRGRSGRLRVEVNARGRVVREWPDPRDAAVAGQDIWLTLDAGLQRFAAEQFGDDSGGLAVVDVMTGELRALLSMPTFDANLFVSGISQADMDRLNGDEKRPQYNKVLSGGYPPASTYKMAVMLAALESGLIDPERPVFCGGKLRLGNRLFHCWKREGHGPVNMRESLKHSCDTYYYEISQIVGIEAIAEAARKLGLGQTYNLGIPGERTGIVPTPSWKETRMGSGWRTGDTLNASIGQGFVLTTPLQLAVMTARLANAKQAVVPSLFAGVDRDSFAPLNISDEALRFVQDAMLSVTNEPGGTAYRLDSLGLGTVTMAGKTGTAQVRGISQAERLAGVRKNEDLPWRYRDHSLFVGYAPYETPRFAVGCVVEHSGSGAGRAATITRAVLGEVLRRDGIGVRAETSDGRVPT
jgi:penicillin-binding protein 2